MEGVDIGDSVRRSLMGSNDIVRRIICWFRDMKEEGDTETLYVKGESIDYSVFTVSGTKCIDNETEIYCGTDQNKIWHVADEHADHILCGNNPSGMLLSYRANVEKFERIRGSVCRSCLNRVNTSHYEHICIWKS